MPRIKRIIPQGYTTVNNDFLRDVGLSVSARGLLVTMLSLPDGWNMSGKGLASILPDGRDKVYSTLNILEEKGYLKREKIRENGRFVDMEYQFCDSPIFLKEENEESSKKKASSLQKKSTNKNSSKNQKTKKFIPLIDFSSISPREERKDEIVKNLKFLKGEERERYIGEKVLEKESCITQLGVPETIFNHVLHVYIDICSEHPEMIEKMAGFSIFDVGALYKKIEGKKNLYSITKRYFMSATPFFIEE